MNSCVVQPNVLLPILITVYTPFSALLTTIVGTQLLRAHQRRGAYCRQRWKSATYSSTRVLPRQQSSLLRNQALLLTVSVRSCKRVGAPGRRDDQHVDEIVVEDLVFPAGARLPVAAAVAELAHDLRKLLLKTSFERGSNEARTRRERARQQGPAITSHWKTRTRQEQ